MSFFKERAFVDIVQLDGRIKLVKKLLCVISRQFF
jgi:hypothetical protein